MSALHEYELFSLIAYTI